LSFRLALGVGPVQESIYENLLSVVAHPTFTIASFASTSKPVAYKSGQENVPGILYLPQGKGPKDRIWCDRLVHGWGIFCGRCPTGTCAGCRRDQLGTLGGGSRAAEKDQRPIPGLFGGEDRGIPPADVEKFEHSLKAMGKSVETHIYPDAGHAFENPNN
jgi:hypothetical protein